MVLLKLFCIPFLVGAVIVAFVGPIEVFVFADRIVVGEEGSSLVGIFSRGCYCLTFLLLLGVAASSLLSCCCCPAKRGDEGEKEEEGRKE